MPNTNPARVKSLAVAPDHAEYLSLRATVKAVASDNPNGEFEAVLSTKAVDREGEVVAPGAFNPLPASIPIFHQHDWQDGAAPIARAIPFYEGEVLKCKGVFASTPRAQEMRTLVNEGIVDSMSVGWVNGEHGQYNGSKAITKGELFESSFTAIPVNPTASVISVRALTNLKAGKRNATTDQENLDKAHDAVVAAGANCTGAKSLRTAEVKAIEGSVEALQDRVRDALEDAYGDAWGYWGYLRGVVQTAGGGTATFDSSQVTDDLDDAIFSQGFTDDGAVVTLVGDAVEVDIVEVVVPDADADRESPALTKAVPKLSAAVKATAPSAAAPTAADDETEELALRARAIRALAATVA